MKAFVSTEDLSDLCLSCGDILELRTTLTLGFFNVFFIYLFLTLLVYIFIMMLLSFSD